MTDRKDTPTWRVVWYLGRTERASCPPHSPIVVDAFDGGYHVASCLQCGLSGPVREDPWEAKVAFDESIK